MTMAFLQTHRHQCGRRLRPGMNAVIMGAALAAGKLGWEVVGIRDGFDGLLHPERYPDGGLVTLDPAADREPGSGRRRVSWANRSGSIRSMSAGE